MWSFLLLYNYVSLYAERTTKMLYTESLKKRKDFQKVYNKGKSFANKYLVMYKLSNHMEENRLGISVSKKVGNSVVRHRITRLIRESYRLNEEQFEKGYDYVVIARATAKGISYSDMESSLLHVKNLHNKKKNVPMEKGKQAGNDKERLDKDEKNINHND